MFVLGIAMFSNLLVTTVVIILFTIYSFVSKKKRKKKLNLVISGFLISGNLTYNHNN